MKSLKKKLIESTKQVNECGSSAPSYIGPRDRVYGGGFGCGGGYIECSSYRRARSTTRSKTKKSIEKTPAKKVNTRLYGRAIEITELIDDILAKCKKDKIKLPSTAMIRINAMKAACQAYVDYVDIFI